MYAECGRTPVRRTPACRSGIARGNQKIYRRACVPSAGYSMQCVHGVHGKFRAPIFFILIIFLKFVPYYKKLRSFRNFRSCAREILSPSRYTHRIFLVGYLQSSHDLFDIQYAGVYCHGG